MLNYTLHCAGLKRTKMKELMAMIVILFFACIGIGFWVLTWIMTGWIGLIVMIVITIAVAIYISKQDVEGNV